MNEAVPVLTLCVLFARVGTTLPFLPVISSHDLALVNQFVTVGPCHHGMPRPQVADVGTASDMEGSCE